MDMDGLAFVSLYDEQATEVDLQHDFSIEGWYNMADVSLEVDAAAERTTSSIGDGVTSCIVTSGPTDLWMNGSPVSHVSDAEIDVESPGMSFVMDSELEKPGAVNVDWLCQDFTLGTDKSGSDEVHLQEIRIREALMQQVCFQGAITSFVAERADEDDLSDMSEQSPEVHASSATNFEDNAVGIYDEEQPGLSASQEHTADKDGESSVCPPTPSSDVASEAISEDQEHYLASFLERGLVVVKERANGHRRTILADQRESRSRKFRNVRRGKQKREKKVWVNRACAKAERGEKKFYMEELIDLLALLESRHTEALKSASS
mmetsp:Transcript_2887/g.8824  ORF Transcript_2887/g.8824 Transcript_2887/m.8824 type:complete len:319 (-) Transcript_2887:376-1332(-)|eukprot:CAMPEP_0198730976 /NCGR_PEP_ID=MMETSP1475-20131203/27357_1 /TAXON_ID= ORGANISM="Unidentified sp., Strain CCMP1999" /NCGR_SAMPLE_ID=MMETSP1475 /ASSEMBLY_ACC=CAM_ASM_001111 /LENGTH=318 /DNA_ID=CAMNT_0044493869 /DNA_START=77 /DNA_END=1033 /DNA_ORIENTATION=+